MRVKTLYADWCEAWVDGLDHPSSVVSLLVKYVASLRRRVNAVKKRNPWLLEVEGNKSLGGFALTGKTNYPAEGCYRIDTMYER